MDKLLRHNIYNARFVIGGFAAAHAVWWYLFSKPQIMYEVYGMDGNGGSMLKIITDLTDEEIARLKHVRRLAWHWKGSRQNEYGRDSISD